MRHLNEERICKPASKLRGAQRRGVDCPQQLASSRGVQTVNLDKKKDSPISRQCSLPRPEMQQPVELEAEYAIALPNGSWE